MWGVWERSESTEARVTPGKIVPSSGGVTTSSAAGRGEQGSGKSQLRRKEDQPRTTICTLKHRKYIHRTSFGDRLAKQPQQLLIAKSSCGALRNEPGRVVQAKLIPARAAGPRAHLVAHGEQRDPPALLVADIRARRRENHVKRRVTRRRDAKRRSRADQRRPNIEAAPSRARNPARLERDEAFNQGQEGICVEWLVVDNYV